MTKNKINPLIDAVIANSGVKAALEAVVADPTTENLDLAIAMVSAVRSGLATLRNSNPAVAAAEIDTVEADYAKKLQALRDRRVSLLNRQDEKCAAQFRASVSAGISAALDAVAETIANTHKAGAIPFLWGLPGNGKTGGTARYCDTHGLALEAISGTETLTSADLLGTPLPSGERVKGVIARAFERARNGEKVVVHLDEVPRFNRRTQDLLMRTLVVVRASTAARLGIPSNGDAYIAEDALWGIEWAPAENIRWVLSGNPWGADIDPALADRLHPVYLDYPVAVAELFAKPLADLIKATWAGARPGGAISVPLPITLRGIETAQHNADTSFIAAYVERLRILDLSGVTAEAFAKFAKTLGVAL